MKKHFLIALFGFLVLTSSYELTFACEDSPKPLPISKEEKMLDVEIWEPDEADVQMLAKLIYGEAGCVKSITEKSAVVWCVLNRVDCSYYPNSVADVVTQYRQFAGYKETHPVKPEYEALARDVLTRWYSGRPGRILPSEYLYFWGDGKHNHFTTGYRCGKEWNWDLESPYES